ncbi:MAG: hypothetical protein KDD76_06080, partial [Rickettsiales bacterium]|nr:hypothetical protein [Rickettsiales bacterium]
MTEAHMLKFLKKQPQADIPKWEQMPRWDDLVEDMPDDRIPLIDRKVLDISKLTVDQKIFRDHGFLILKDFLPENLVDAYVAKRERL